jgi:hypothetical protein
MVDRTNLDLLESKRIDDADLVARVLDRNRTWSDPRQSSDLNIGVNLSDQHKIEIVGSEFRA